MGQCKPQGDKHCDNCTCTCKHKWVWQLDWLWLYVPVNNFSVISGYSDKVATSKLKEVQKWCAAFLLEYERVSFESDLVKIPEGKFKIILEVTMCKENLK